MKRSEREYNPPKNQMLKLKEENNLLKTQIRNMKMKGGIINKLLKENMKLKSTNPKQKRPNEYKKLEKLNEELNEKLNRLEKSIMGSGT